MSNFYNNYVRLCVSNSVSVTRAAKAVGLSGAAANGWKNGKIPSDITQRKLADYFGVTVEDLLSEQKGTADPKVGGREKVLSQFADKIMDGPTIVKLVETELKSRKIPKAEFYRETKISSTTFSQWRNGLYSPSTSSIKAIEDFLGIEVKYSVSISKNEQKETADPKAGGSGESLEDIIPGYDLLTEQNKARLRDYAAVLLAAQRSG